MRRQNPFEVYFRAFDVSRASALRVERGRARGDGLTVSFEGISMYHVDGLDFCVGVPFVIAQNPGEVARVASGERGGFFYEMDSKMPVTGRMTAGEIDFSKWPELAFENKRNLIVYSGAVSRAGVYSGDIRSASKRKTCLGRFEVRRVR